MADEKSNITLSVVIPVKDEANQLAALFDRLMPVIDGLDMATEILFVNDGSTDDTVARLLAFMKTDRRIHVIDLSRNFGKEAALAAGMHSARGAAVITMDADCQDPPEIIPEFIARWRDGAEMVVGQRADRKSDGRIKYKSADWFYFLFNQIGDTPLIPHAGDFRLFDRQAIQAYKQLGESNRFNKGLFAWLGFRQDVVPYKRARSERRSRWQPMRLFMLAVDAFISFSTVPIRLWTGLGLLTAFAALGIAGFIAATTLIYGRDVPGYASLMVAILLTSGINMIGIGLLGEYISRTFTESKKRPLYIIRKHHHSDES